MGAVVAFGVRKFESGEMGERGGKWLWSRGCCL